MRKVRKKEAARKIAKYIRTSWHESGNLLTGEKKLQIFLLGEGIKGWVESPNDDLVSWKDSCYIFIQQEEYARHASVYFHLSLHHYCCMISTGFGYGYYHFRNLVCDSIGQLVAIEGLRIFFCVTRRLGDCFDLCRLLTLLQTTIHLHSLSVYTKLYTLTSKTLILYGVNQ